VQNPKVLHLNHSFITYFRILVKQYIYSHLNPPATEQFLLLTFNGSLPIYFTGSLYFSPSAVCWVSRHRHTHDAEDRRTKYARTRAAPFQDGGSYVWPEAFRDSYFSSFMHILRIRVRIWEFGLVLIPKEKIWI